MGRTQKGWFGLKAPTDLLAKLQREAKRVEDAPLDPDHAFNFCITGYHLLDWTYGKGKSKVLEQEPLLKVLYDLANGIKHFELERPFGAVKVAGGMPSWAEYPFRISPGKRVINARMLYVQLDGDAAKQFGWIISVPDLAKKTLGFWKSQIPD
ncbi:MAG TPA: hypothetical protein VGR25_08015 [bacterium]|jgi:hypothetical protein|nr:hypothetical protein [bacterium]